MINHRPVRSCVASLLQIAALSFICSWPCLAVSGTPLVTAAEGSAVLDRYSQSPRLQFYSRPGARFETRVSGPVTPEDSSDESDEEIVQSQSVNINSASAEELAAALPGIGPSKAQGIIEWREQHGPFRTIDQLLEVSGIGPRTLENIRPYVRLGDSLSKRSAATGLPREEDDVVMALSAIILRANEDRRQALLQVEEGSR